MTGLHSRTVELVGDDGGNAVGTIGVPTGRYAGTFYTFKEGGLGSISIENLRRVVFSKSGASNEDAVTELVPSDEHLVHGECEISIGGAAGGTVDITIFLDY